MRKMITMEGLSLDATNGANRKENETDLWGLIKLANFF